ncbi:MAG: carboxypeptidase-like regulatory domain-containing protein [Candidatus Acidiferrales bacterium]
MSMTTAGTHRAVYFQVVRAYRGLASEKVAVLTGIGLGDCGFDFETGKQYLVYADRIDADKLFTSICTGTSSLEQAGPALRFLRGEQPTPDDLLDLQTYYGKFMPQWTGKVCGRVTRPDGNPLGKASVNMTQVRDEPFPPNRADDPNGSNADGSFCIPNISPGKYLLCAESADYHNYFRWMGYFPGVRKRAEATPIEVHAGDNLVDLQFTVRKEPLYTTKFRIVTPDGSLLPLESLGVSVDSPYQDALSYHLTQNRNENGLFYAGYVPPGYYTVQTYIQPDPDTGKIPPGLSNWRMAKQEVVVPSDTEIVVLKLLPVM